MSYTDHVSIIDAWPSLREFAADIGASYNTTKHIRRRGRIPAEYWTRLVEAAGRRQLTGVDFEMLARLYSAPSEDVEQSPERTLGTEALA